MYAGRRWVISGMCMSRTSFSRTILSSLQATSAPASVRSSTFRSPSCLPQHQHQYQPSSESKHSGPTSSTPRTLTTSRSQLGTSSPSSKRPTPIGGSGSIMAARPSSLRTTSRRSLRPHLLPGPYLPHTSHPQEADPYPQLPQRRKSTSPSWLLTQTSTRLRLRLLKRVPILLGSSRTRARMGRRASTVTRCVVPLLLAWWFSYVLCRWPTLLRVV